MNQPTRTSMPDGAPPRSETGRASADAASTAEWSDLQVGPTRDLPSPVNDCWNVIGVEGNVTCRELQKYIHCRNCPVYSAAGLQLLDRPLTPDYRRERTAQFSLAKKTTQPARTSVVLFRLGPEWLALPTPAFQEVAQRRIVHSLPHRRRSIALGLVNIRGELLICASLARLLGLPETSGTAAPATSPAPTGLLTMGTHFAKRRDPETGRDALPRARAAAGKPGVPFYERLLVTNWNGQRLALPVDEVQGIQRIQADETKEPPATISKSALTYTRGVFTWRERSVGLLDAEGLFTALNRSLT